MPRGKAKKAVRQITFEGLEMVVPKRDTQLTSLNMLLGGGLPSGGVTELAGWTESGKTTLGLHLMGTIDPNGTIIYCETERRGETEYIGQALWSSGFGGTVYSVPYGRNDSSSESGEVKPGRGRKKKSAGNPLAFSDETRIDMAIERFRSDPKASGLMLDSVGGIIPTPEVEGDISDAHVGLRARLMAKFMRKINNELRHKKNPCHVIVVNHLQPIIGGQGNHTVGGTAIGFLTSVQLRLSVEEKEDDGSRTVVVSHKKLTFRRGSSLTQAKFYILGDGGGVSVNMSAVIDSLYLGLATKENGVVKLGSKSFGRFSKMKENVSDDDLFKPFFDALRKYNG